MSEVKKMNGKKVGVGTYMIPMSLLYTLLNMKDTHMHMYLKSRNCVIVWIGKITKLYISNITKYISQIPHFSLKLCDIYDI